MFLRSIVFSLNFAFSLEVGVSFPFGSFYLVQVSRNNGLNFLEVNMNSLQIFPVI